MQPLLTCAHPTTVLYATTTTAARVTQGSCPSCRPYTKAEWRMGLLLSGASNVSITGLTVVESGGDGVMIVGGSRVTFRNCTFDRNYRQGMSVIAVENLMVEDCTFSNTNGTDPQSGVDIEPDLPSQNLINITFAGCSFRGNSGAGFATCLNALNASSRPVSITFRDAQVSNNSANERSSGFSGCSVCATYFRPGLRGSVTYDGIVLEDTPVAGIQIREKAANSPLLTLRNISLARTSSANRGYPDPAPGPDTYTVSPVMMVSALLPNVNGFLGGFPTLGGVVFDGVRIADSFDRPWMFVWTTDGVVPVWSSIVGTASGVSLVNPDGGCWVKHNRTNATAAAPFRAACSLGKGVRAAAVARNQGSGKGPEIEQQ